MFVTKDRPGAGAQNRRDRTIEDTTSPMEGHGPLYPLAEHARGRREAAQVELKPGFRASEETLQGLIEASLQGVLIVTKECEPLLANQIFARIFGFESPAEIMALDSIAGLIASPTLARLGAFRTESLDGSETTEIHEFDGVRKDGSIVRLKSMAGPIDWQGRRAVVLTLIEITGHEKSEGAPPEREAQLRAIMDNVPAEIYRTHEDGRYPSINRHYEDLRRVKDEEVRGYLAGDIHAPETFAEVSGARGLAMLQSERPKEHEQVVLLEDSVHTRYVIEFPVRDADGKVSGLGAIAADVTERKHAEVRTTIGLCQDGGQRGR